MSEDVFESEYLLVSTYAGPVRLDGGPRRRWQLVIFVDGGPHVTWIGEEDALRLLEALEARLR